jgi:hypothetical protein
LNFSDPPSRVSSTTPFDMISTWHNHVPESHTNIKYWNEEITWGNYKTYIRRFSCERALRILARARVSRNHGTTGSSRSAIGPWRTIVDRDDEKKTLKEKFRHCTNHASRLTDLKESFGSPFYTFILNSRRAGVFFLYRQVCICCVL